MMVVYEETEIQCRIERAVCNGFYYDNMGELKDFLPKKELKRLNFFGTGLEARLCGLNKLVNGRCLNDNSGSIINGISMSEIYRELSIEYHKLLRKAFEEAEE